MEYENTKKFQRKEENVDSSLNQIITNQPQHTGRSVGSTVSLQSTSYQTFYLEDDLEPVPAGQNLLQRQSELSPAERRRAMSMTATYSYPKQPNRIRSNKSHQEDEEGYAYATTESMAPKRKNKSNSTSQLPSASVSVLPSIVDQPLPLPPRPVVFTDSGQSDIQLGDSPTVQMSEHPVRKISESIAVQPYLTKHEGQMPDSEPTQSFSGFHTQTPSAAVSAKPLVMKLLPLYLCMDEGKVYADRNAASIPTHHLVEVNVIMESNISMLNSAEPLQDISTKNIDDSHKRKDPLTHPNPVYETVSRNKIAHKMVSVSDEPDGRNVSPSPVQSCSPSPLPKPNLDHFPIPDSSSTASDTMPETRDFVVDASTAAPLQQSMNINIDQENVPEIHVASDGKLKPTTSTLHADKVPNQQTAEQSQGSLTALLPMRRFSYGHHENLTGFGEPAHEVHSHLYLTIVAAIVVGLCLDFIVLLICFVPALWFANKASQSKHSGKPLEVRKYGRRVLLLNIVGVVSHVFFIVTVIVIFFATVLISVL